MRLYPGLRRRPHQAFTKELDFRRTLSGLLVEERSNEPKILPLYHGDILRRLCVQHAPVQTSTYKTDSNGYIICSPEKPKIIDADPRPITRGTLSGE